MIQHKQPKKSCPRHPGGYTYTTRPKKTVPDNTNFIVSLSSMDLPYRKRIRMDGYDYRSAGAYFVTICTQDKVSYFGAINNGVMDCNALGTACTEIIQQLPQRRSTIDIHEFVVMPNHIHMIIVMGARTPSMTKPVIDRRRETLLAFPDTNNTHMTNDTTKSRALQDYQGPTLGSIIGMMKQSVTKYATMHNIPFARQTRFHEHIIRNQKEYEHIVHYITQNPEKRSEDKFFDGS